MSDGNSLSLLIKNNGSKIWRFRYLRPETKKANQLSLGEYPFISLAEALGCNESTLYRWLKDETIKLPKPIQIGKKKVCFIYDEIVTWLYSRPRFNSFYNVSTKKFELTNVKSTETLVSKHLMNEKTTIEFINEQADLLLKDQKILIPCISIKNIKLFNWLVVEKYLGLRFNQAITPLHENEKEREYIIPKNL